MGDQTHDLRCFCSRHPLLGLVRREEGTGEPFVHVKVFKSGRVFGEVVVTEGVVHLRCRECHRWHRVRILRTSVDFSEEGLPESLGLERI